MPAVPENTFTPHSFDDSLTSIFEFTRDVAPVAAEAKYRDLDVVEPMDAQADVADHQQKALFGSWCKLEFVIRFLTDFTVDVRDVATEGATHASGSAIVSYKMTDQNKAASVRQFVEEVAAEETARENCLVNMSVSASGDPLLGSAQQSRWVGDNS